MKPTRAEPVAHARDSAVSAGAIRVRIAGLLPLSFGR